MKVIIFDNNNLSADKNLPVGWYIVADSALSNWGKPFYVPENCNLVTVSLSMALKISKLGKYISPRFAGRYFHEFAPALHFRLPELRSLLMNLGLPVTPALSFDKSVMTADFKELPENPKDISMSLKLNGSTRAEWKFTDLNIQPEELIHNFSIMNTLKMGDLILPSLTVGVPVVQGDVIEVESPLFSDLRIKVK